MAIRQRRRSDDPFFADGDFVSLQDSQTSAIFYMDENRFITHTDQDYDSYDEYFLPSFPCSALQCSEVFSTQKECEAHYIKNHTFECRVCNKFFPHDSILDLVSNLWDRLFCNHKGPHAVFAWIVLQDLRRYTTQQSWILLNHHDCTLIQLLLFTNVALIL